MALCINNIDKSRSWIIDENILMFFNVFMWILVDTKGGLNANMTRNDIVQLRAS